jgi:hypothetical protein
MYYIKYLYLDMFRAILCSKHVEVEVFNVIHILQNKGIVHQIGNWNKFIQWCTIRKTSNSAKHVIINSCFILNRTYLIPPHQVKLVISWYVSVHLPFFDDFSVPPPWSSNWLIYLKFLQRDERHWSVAKSHLIRRAGGKVLWWAKGQTGPVVARVPRLLPSPISVLW